MKRNILLGISLSVFLLLLSACAGKENKNYSSGLIQELVILHTNDHHGAILAENSMGGLAERSIYITQSRTIHPNVLLLDAGDLNSGPILSNFFNGELDVKIYNLLGYDAMTLGNHEFDRGLESLLVQMEMADFPFLAANIIQRDGTHLGVPWMIKNYPGLKVGIFGLTTVTTTTRSIIPADLIFLDEIDSAFGAVKYLRETEKCDIVIALTHMGLKEETPDFTTSIKLAEAVDGIDLIIDGHSHDYMEEPLVIKDTPIVMAGHGGRYVGKAELHIEDGHITGFQWQAVPITAGSLDLYPPDAQISALINTYKIPMESHFSQPIGTASAEFPYTNRLARSRENASANLVNEASLWYVKEILGHPADFAFTNAGTVRAGFNKGTITLGNLHEVLPFDNNLHIVTFTGSQLKKMFEHVASFLQGSGGWGQVSSDIRYTVDYSSGKGKLKNLTVKNMPVEDNREYTMVTNDFITRGGNRYTVKQDSLKIEDTGVNLRTSLEEYIRQHEQVIPVTDGRIKVIGGE